MSPLQGLGEYGRALRRLEAAAGKGLAVASAQLGKLRQVGAPRSRYPLPRDLAAAEGHYRDAAALGHGEAKYLLGMMALDAGRGAEAVRWFAACVEPEQRRRDAAADGGRSGAPVHTVNALFQLGLLLQAGEGGVERDLQGARRWWEQAAELRFAPAIFNLGVMYADGLGVPADRTRAQACFAAAKALNPNLAVPGASTPSRSASYTEAVGNDAVRTPRLRPGRAAATPWRDRSQPGGWSQHSPPPPRFGLEPQGGEGVETPTPDPAGSWPAVPREQAAAAAAVLVLGFIALRWLARRN